MELPPSEADDEQLMDACSRGDRKAFDTLMQHHFDVVVTFLRGLTRDADAAEDLAQDTFLAVWQRRASYVRRSKVRTWILTIARNRYVDWVRKRSLPLPAAREADAALPPDAALQRRELIDQALRLLATLSETERTVVVLYFLEGMPYREIAEVVGTSENTIRACASDARAKLRKALS